MVVRAAMAIMGAKLRVVKIRGTAVLTQTPIMTTLSGAKAAAMGIAAIQKSGWAVRTVQEYH
jgi:hypothetical protein